MGFNSIRLDPADIAFSKYIRLRDKKCRRCGSEVTFNEKGLPVSHQASHFQGRRKENTRFDERNCDCLCPGCHQYLGSNPGEHYMWQVKKKGQKTVDLIIYLSNQYCKKDRKMQKIYWTERIKQDFGIKA